jgi:DNA-binding MarR family transcriptional regulator
LSFATTEEIISTAELRVALRRFFRATEIAARRSDLTPRQYLLLLLVKGAPDGSECANIGNLAERMQLAQSTVTELVARAVTAGLVTATHSEDDGRVTQVRLTPEGSRRMLDCFGRLGGERATLREELAGQLVYETV